MTSLDLTDPSQFGFPPNCQIYQLDPEIRKAIIEAFLRIRGPENFHQFWKILLTDDERDLLGGNIERCFEKDPICVNHLGQLRNWSPERATIEIAYQLGFLTSVRFDQLLVAIGVEPRALGTNNAGANRPSWDLKSGRLEWNGQLLRQVKVSVATVIVPVLDAFEDADWCPCIENPIESIDPQKIHEIVQSLNTDLMHLRFRVQGENICWNLESPPTS